MSAKWVRKGLKELMKKVIEKVVGKLVKNVAKAKKSRWKCGKLQILNVQLRSSKLKKLRLKVQNLKK